MIRQAVKMAWKSIASNKMRSFLTMLGIIIGVMSLVVLVSLVSGTTESVTDQISSIGTNLLTVTVQDDKGRPLKLADVSELAEDEELEAAAPVAQSSVAAASSYSEEYISLYGTTGDYYDIQGLELYAGRFIKNIDVEKHTNVAVINAGLATEVMGRMDVAGETIKFNGTEYQIIGVLAAKDSDSSTTENYEAYIPYTSLIRLTDDVSSDVTAFCASAASEETLDDAQDALSAALMERFNEDEDAFTVINQSAVMEAMESVTDTLALLLGGIAAISLLVGGIGIMNIMLVSVTERTREIGIRKAIGAGKGTIMLQFLIEALMISLMGCAVGIFLSWVTLRIISGVGGDDMNYELRLGVVWISIAFSMGIGIIFGIYPADKAAKKQPIDALRYAG
ncbi:ABC transporter permease [Dorea sp. D27]|uniref:ABC transporter permease n=1 Tax=Dorea sp. D27 TaxID=658665 RepID=UPI000673BB4F|nr:ABC transporter permease [Dorea sp. D27]KMZ53340.1 macrolide export ATP-binding/permease protein MacB [Dorea sp. D27]